MKHQLIGTIREHRIKKRIVYSLSLFKGKIIYKTSSKKLLLAKVQEHSIGLIKTQEIDSLSIRYINQGRIMHYLLVEKNYQENKINIFEETAYEFHKSHPYYFSSDINRRVINERHYNLGELVRISSNFRQVFNIINVFLLLILIFFSGYASVLILDLLPQSTIKTKNIWSFYIFISFLLVLFLSGLGIFIIWYSNLLKAKNRNSNYIFDWKSDNKRKQIFRFLDGIFLVCNAILIFTFIQILDSSYAWQKNIPASIFWVYFSMLIIVAMFELAYFFWVNVSLKLNFKKYYPGKKWSIFRKWYFGQNEKDISGEMNSIFLFPPDHSSFLHEKNKQITKVFLRKLSNFERKVFIKKLKDQLNKASAIYLQKLKENYEHISKNN